MKKFSLANEQENKFLCSIGANFKNRKLLKIGMEKQGKIKLPKFLEEGNIWGRDI